MSPEERQGLINALGRAIVDEVKLGLEPIKQELTRLTLKLEAAELQVREYRFAGVWSERGTYRKGNTVVHAGSTWHCNLDGIGTVPGKDHDGWTLVAKRGADAPGARI
jgi:hypothetical protein